MKAQNTQPLFMYVSNIFFLLLTYFSSLNAQNTYQWLIPDHDYIRIKTHTTGMHILLRDELLAAGLTPDADPRTFKIFHHGKEQAIRVLGESDGSFDASDTILFFGKRNDGTLDARHYKTGVTPPHTFVSIYSDTSVYYLSWGEPGTPRRMPQLTAGVATDQAYHYDEIRSFFHEDYARGANVAKNTESILDTGETWSTRYRHNADPLFHTITGIQQLYNAGPAATLTVQVMGVNYFSISRKVMVIIGDVNNPVFKDSIEGFPYFQTQTKSFSIPVNLLNSGSLEVKVIPALQSDGSAQPKPNDVSINYIILRYPQQINSGFSNGKILSFSATDNLHITSAWTGTGAHCYDISVADSVNIIGTTYDGNETNINIPSFCSTVWMGNNAAFLRSFSVTPFHYTMPDTTASYLILSNRLLQAGTEEYADYRRSMAGGNHDVQIEYVDYIFDVFSYGEFTPYAIKDYCLYQKEKNPSATFLFLIGKALDPYYNFNDGIRHYYRWEPDLFHHHPGSFNMRNMVPTYGSPASDQYYVVDNSNIPFMSVGRISSRNNEQIIAYLNKVKEHEQLDSNYSWRKNMVHLSGGKDLAEAEAFEITVNGFKNIAENSTWGGKVVKTITKNLSSGTVVSHVSITDEVNAGLSYVTYFGHSSFTLLELDLGNVSTDIYGYRNKGKYPLLFLNGCNSAHSYVGYSIAEDWLNTADRGAIAAIGSSDEAYTDQLSAYTVGYYNAAFNDPIMMHKSSGEIMRHVLSTTSNLNKYIRWQMNLHGDPAIRMYNPAFPDYEISGDEETREDIPPAKVFLKTPDGSKLTAATPEFSIGIPIKNFGTLDSDSFSVFVRRTVNGTTTSYPIMSAKAIRYLDTVYFRIEHNNLLSNFGMNRFEIFVDFHDSIREMREDNNYATLNYFMPVNVVSCLYPKEFSIVHTQPIKLIAQSTDLMSEQNDYYFELDTSFFFTSDFKRSAVISSGALAKWENQTLISDNNIDSLVYYWRVRQNIVPEGQDTLWSTSSFIYIKNSPDGWSQARVGQLSKNNFQHVSVSEPNKHWEFSSIRKKIMAQCFGNGDSLDFNDFSTLSIGDIRLLFPGYWIAPCWKHYRPDLGENTSTEFDGMYAIAFNNSSLEIFEDNTHPDDRCGRAPYAYLSPFINLSLPFYQSQFISWLNAVPDEYYILIGSSGNAFYNNWGSTSTPGTLRNILATQYGATLMDELDNHEPYILLSQKGGTPIAEKHSNDLFSFVTLDTFLTSRYNSGVIYSTVIGPSKQWGTCYKRVDSLDGLDHSYVGIIRYNINGTSDTLRQLNFSKNTHNIDTLDLSSIIPNAAQYPNIKLFVQLSDTASTFSPPYLNKWQVIYHKVPEGTMNPNVAAITQYKQNESNEEGKPLCYKYVFENISDISFDDSLKVTATISNALTGQKDSTFILTVDSLKAGQSVEFPYCFKTTGLSGNSTFRMFVNPEIQPEQQYSNNILETYVTIDRDKTPPVIDVTFDKVHILDGDIVSPNPMINISLQDNSSYLLMNDPTAINLFLKRPGAAANETIAHTHPDIMHFGQDPGKTNKFSIEYNPKNLSDGTYKIIVQGADVNGNKSGNFYSISFEVVNASTITNIYPYPNPFSSATQFVFTLTGNEIPEDMKIQIMTVTGKVVREITKEELGEMHIGNNRTQYAWNGTDEFGDKLANGVYLYRVVIKNKQDHFQHRDSGGDKSFTKEFGKIYILR